MRGGGWGWVGFVGLGRVGGKVRLGLMCFRDGPHLGWKERGGCNLLLNLLVASESFNPCGDFALKERGGLEWLCLICDRPKANTREVLGFENGDEGLLITRKGCAVSLLLARPCPATPISTQRFPLAVGRVMWGYWRIVSDLRTC